MCYVEPWNHVFQHHGQACLYVCHGPGPSCGTLGPHVCTYTIAQYCHEGIKGMPVCVPAMYQYCHVAAREYLFTTVPRLITTTWAVSSKVSCAPVPPCDAIGIPVSTHAVCQQSHMAGLACVFACLSWASTVMSEHTCLYS